MSDIDSKIQEVLDKESIRELVHLYCRAADRHDHELMRELYHEDAYDCLLYTSPSPRDLSTSRMPSSA